MSVTKKFLVPVICAGLLAPSLPAVPASAAPLPKPGLTTPGDVTYVGRRGRGRGWYRGRRGGRWYGSRRRGPNGAAIIGGIIAGALIAAAIREGRARDYDIRRCEEDFYSFDPRTGTYINRYGEERVCPYLR